MRFLRGGRPVVLALLATGLALGSCSERPLTAGLDPAPGPPVMALASSAVDFVALTHGLAPMQVIAISNAGQGTLGGLGIGGVNYAGEGGWLTASLSGVTAPATLMLQTAAGNLAPGTYYASLDLVATGASNSPRTIAISFRVDAVAPGPIIGLSATAAAFGGTPGGLIPSQSVQILPASDTPLVGLSISNVTYDPAAAGWLGAVLGGNEAPVTLTLQPSAQGLSPGTYDAVVSIAASGAINSPRTIRVTLTITSAPVAPSLRLSTTAVSLAATSGQPGQSQAVTVTNGGGGTLGSLSTGAIVYGAGAAGWLQPALSSTSAPATLLLTPVTTGLPAGTFQATIPVSAAGATDSPQSVAVTLVVGQPPPTPILAVSPTSLSFTAVTGSTLPPNQAVGVSNVGGGVLGSLGLGVIAYTAGGNGWLQASLSSTSAPATVQLALTPAASLLPVGTYGASFPIASPSATNGPLTVQVALIVTTVAPPPAPPPPPPPPAPPPPPPPAAAIALSPVSLSFSGTAGGASPAAKTVAVTNSGGGTLGGLTLGTLTYGAGASGWASATLSGGSAPATLTVTPTLGALTTGTYTASVPVSAAGASNTPQSVTVTFTVSPGTAQASFASDVYPTFHANCLASGCHVPGQQKPNLGSVAEAYGSLVTAGTKYVVPGDPNTGLLLGTLQGTTGPQMPPSGRLSAAFITLVKTWIQQGAKNN